VRAIWMSVAVTFIGFLNIRPRSRSQPWWSSTTVRPSERRMPWKLGV
jgi:hypothetical protein